MNPRAAAWRSALAMIACGLAAHAAPAPLKPAVMRLAGADTSPHEPKLVPVHMHAPPAIAMPAEGAMKDELLGPADWMRGNSGPSVPEPIAAPLETPSHPVGWLSRDDKKAKEDEASARRPGQAAGWLAQGVYAIEAREEHAAIRDASDPSDLDLDLDAADADRDNAWFGAGKERRQSDWSSTARDRWKNSDAAPYSSYGVQGGDLVMPGDAMPSPREQDFALPAYGNTDDGR